MTETFQCEDQNIYEHGLSVSTIILNIWLMLKFGTPNNLNLILPDWFIKYRHFIVSDIPNLETILEYTVFHDCGKPLAREVDAKGKQHFPNHSAISSSAWKEFGLTGNDEAAELMARDMIIHTIDGKRYDHPYN